MRPSDRSRTMHGLMVTRAPIYYSSAFPSKDSRNIMAETSSVSHVRRVFGLYGDAYRPVVHICSFVYSTGIMLSKQTASHPTFHKLTKVL